MVLLIVPCHSLVRCKHLKRSMPLRLEFIAHVVVFTVLRFEVNGLAFVWFQKSQRAVRARGAYVAKILTTNLLSEITLVICARCSALAWMEWLVLPRVSVNPQMCRRWIFPATRIQVQFGGRQPPHSIYRYCLDHLSDVGAQPIVCDEDHAQVVQQADSVWQSIPTHVPRDAISICVLCATHPSSAQILACCCACCGDQRCINGECKFKFSM